MVAAREGTTLKAVVTRALQAEFARDTSIEGSPPSWRRAFGGLSHLKHESDQINGAIEEAFESIDEADWQ